MLYYRDLDLYLKGWLAHWSSLAAFNLKVAWSIKAILLQTSRSIPLELLSLIDQLFLTVTCYLTITRTVGDGCNVIRSPESISIGNNMKGLFRYAIVSYWSEVEHMQLINKHVLLYLSLTYLQFKMREVH